MATPLLHIGATKEAIDAARRTILDILNTSNEQETKRVALSIFPSLCEVKNTIVSGCNFTSNPPVKSKKGK